MFVGRVARSGVLCFALRDVLVVGDLMVFCFASLLFALPCLFM